MKVLLPQASDLYSFNLFILNGYGIGAVELGRASLIGKIVIIVGDLGVYSLVKIDMIIGRRF